MIPASVTPDRSSPDGGPEKENEDAQGRQPTARGGGLPFTGLQLALLVLTASLLAAGGWAIRRFGKERRP